MVLTEIISAVRIELQDMAETFHSDDEIIRAIQKCVSLMSRLLPKRDIVEGTVVREITGETLTIASSTGTLAYKPIKAGSLVITGKTLDTDYRINYLTGVVTEIGSNLPDTNYTAGYNLDPLMFDISSLLSDYIRIERLEYPAGSSPVSIVTFDIIGDFIVLRGSNLSFTEDKHIRLIYLGRWTAPTLATEGDYPSHLDDAVIIGATGEALIFRAEELVNEAFTLFQTANTTLGSIDTHLTAAVVALAAALTEFGIAKTTVANAALTTAFSDADTALDAAATQLAAAISTLSSMATSQGKAATALDKIAAEVVLGAAFLQTGKVLINASTYGNAVGEIYGRYSDAEAHLAATYATEAAHNIALARSYVDKSIREGAVGNSYTNEGIQRLAVVSRYLDKATQETNIANGYLSEAVQRQTVTQRYFEKSSREEAIAIQYLNVAGRCLASGQAKINEFLVSLGLKAEFPVQKASSEQRA